MMIMWHVPRCASRALLVGVLLIAPHLQANAQVTTTSSTTTSSTTTSSTTLLPVTTHLKCYRVMDSLRLKGPLPSWLDLDSPQFGIEHCRISGSFRLLCVPVTKTITAEIEGAFGRLAPFEPLTAVPITNAQELTQEQICYRIRCENRLPSPPNPSGLFTDQFGTRELKKFKPIILCGPAIQSLCGDGEVGPAEECDDGNTISGDCCDSRCQFEALGASCADTDGEACTQAGCDGAGMCVQTQTFKAAGTTCPNTDETVCTVPGCDGAGTCDQNSSFRASGFGCEETDNNACTVPGCDGAGACIQTSSFRPLGFSCPEEDANACTISGCDGAGTCDQDYAIVNCSPPLVCNPATGQCQSATTTTTTVTTTTTL